jgi:hypothetical protein
MKPGHISFEPRAHVRFSPDDIKSMLECSAAHYDHKCKMAGIEASDGTLGILVKIRNYHENLPDDDSLYKIRWHDLDTIAKILEMSTTLGDSHGFGLMFEVKRAMDALNEAAGDVGEIDISGSVSNVPAHQFTSSHEAATRCVECGTSFSLGNHNND